MDHSRIFNTQKKAEMAAKRNACEKLGVKYRASRYFLKKTQYSATCYCGETNGIIITAFNEKKHVYNKYAGGMIDESASSDLYGYCSTCGNR